MKKANILKLFLSIGLLVLIGGCVTPPEAPPPKEEVAAVAEPKVEPSTQTGVTGVVHYSTIPLSGVRVDLFREDEGTPIPGTTVHTDQEGRYTILYDTPSAYVVWLNHNAPLPEYATVGQTITINAGEITVQDMDLPKKLSLLSPSNGATINNVTPTLTWETNPQAVRYGLQVNIESTWELVLMKTDITATSYTFQEPLSKGTAYAWCVDGWDGHSPHNHWVATSDTFTFTIE